MMPRNSATEAFTRQSPHFEEEEKANPIISYIRQRVQQQLLHSTEPGQQVLELNAGTGMDAAFLARQERNVTATELAGGMYRELKAKARQPETQGRLSAVQLDFHQLDQLNSGPFDLVFSNFGGLNCTPELAEVFQPLAHLLKPGGRAVLVMMPPVCPWELSYLLRGKGYLALRRLNGKAPAHLEGTHFDTWYYTPRQVRRAFPPGFQQVGLAALGSLVPQPHMVRFPEKLPKFYAVLQQIEERVAHWPLIRQWADHYMITLQKPDNAK
jgi:ubiquinone/menaquinone biosynthesis C-methylase UbiE